MFCYQCEQAAKGTGCTTIGICGKTPEVAALQDLLIRVIKGISMYANRARALGVKDADTDHFVMDALFTTVTNVNFDVARMEKILKEGENIRNRIKSLYIAECEKQGITPEDPGCPSHWSPKETTDALIDQGRCGLVTTQQEKIGDDLTGLQELLIYGLKGMAAYACHARILGQEDDSIYAFTHEALAHLIEAEPTVDDLLALNLKCGEISITTLAILDAANTGTYGKQTPTKVLMGHKKGKAILISGHDLKDLEMLLKQTEGKGINVYTHGEMLPAHAYPELNKYPHLAGNYGGAWQKQRKEFSEFPGAILMTTNCIQEPKPDYIERIFTCGLVAWPDVTHIEDSDFSAVIDAALAAKGFTDNSEEKYHTVGFGHHTVLSIADTVIDAVKQGAIKRFMLVGGCDGHEAERNYFNDVVEKAPDDWIVLTLGCGKFRVIDNDLGEIGGIPRILDMGQCNDSFSAVKVALALAEAFETDVNGLPLSLVISWFEQKAVCVLLALLHLGVKNIRLGPKLPAFITPAVLNVLVEKFNIMPTIDAEEDLKAMASA
ncbi:MAG: hydroxylamine reductase [Alphaproteobacteria bacterium]|nr:hydroxylamine reductase [Alphaproteobacteria bacterium]